MATKKVGVGDLVKESKIFHCSKCKINKAMLEGERAPRCPACSDKKHHWVPSKYKILLQVKDVEHEIRRRSTKTDLVSDKITAFCGSMTFVILHVIWFTAWIVYNVMAPDAFDPYPFGFLTLVVSLEAILLATFIMVSQNRETLVNNLRAELDYQVDLRSAKLLSEIKSMLTDKRRRRK